MGVSTSLVVVDTNVLLAATDRSRANHVRATLFLDRDERRLVLTPQIVREYLAVATRPTEVNGLGLPADTADRNLGRLLADIALLPENDATVAVLRDLVRRGSATGKQIHDANVVAVALAHGARTIVTDNARHFSRFEDLIGIESLSNIDGTGEG